MRRYQIAASVLVGVIIFIYGMIKGAEIDSRLQDIGWAYNAVWDLCEGRDPYRHESHKGMIPYPLTAAIVIMPVVLLLGKLAVPLLFGLASGWIAWGLIRQIGWGGLLIFLSPAMIMSLYCLQWSVFIFLALLYPCMSWVIVAKPTLALPVLWANRPGWLFWIIAASVGAVSLMAMPDWIFRWLGQTRSYNGFIPLLTLPGVLLVIALNFRKNPWAIYFITLLLTPQHTLYYDQLLLWKLARDRFEILFLNFCSWAGYILTVWFYDSLLGSGDWIVIFLYWPCFLLLMRHHNGSSP